MRQDTSVSEGTDTAGASAGIRWTRLRADHFDLVTNMLGHGSDEEKSAFVGASYSWLRRARKGEPVGERFIAGTLDSLRKHREVFTAAGVPITFESLFETTGAPR